MTSNNQSPRDRLADLGNVYVTLEAAQSYARATRTGIEEARQRLTEVLLDAHPVESSRDGRSDQWRRRSRTLGVDVQARVVYEEELCVVVHASVRYYATSAEKKARALERGQGRR